MKEEFLDENQYYKPLGFSNWTIIGKNVITCHICNFIIHCLNLTKSLDIGLKKIIQGRKQKIGVFEEPLEFLGNSKIVPSDENRTLRKL